MAKDFGHVKEWIEHCYFMAQCRQMWSNVVRSHTRELREAQWKELAGNQNRMIVIRWKRLEAVHPLVSIKLKHC
jgi:hypothetical protein